MLVCGGDEAGRGAVVGPLVIALVSIKKSAIPKLSEIGVRDSKMLTRSKRSELFKKITKMASEIMVSKISPVEINEAMRNKISLNELEATHISKLFDGMKTEASYLYLDSPDVIPEKFAIRVNMQTIKPTKVIGVKSKHEKGKTYTKIISEHKADSRYPVVSAASIIAKVIRDQEVKNLEKKIGIKIGSGYPSDSKTVTAILDNLDKEIMIPHVREYWKTMDKIRQTKLIDY